MGTEKQITFVSSLLVLLHVTHNCLCETVASWLKMCGMAIVAIPWKYVVRNGSFTVQNRDNRSLSGGRQLVYLVSLYEWR